MIFKFNQAVGGTLGAVRVYDAQGQEVDNLAVSHPEGHEHWMGVGLKPGLPDGTYTATYRVISADTHIVYGGIVVQHRPCGRGAEVHRGGLIGRNESGEVTDDRVRRRARSWTTSRSRLLLGGLMFVLVAWLPGARGRRQASEPAWQRPRARSPDACELLLLVAIVLGVLVSVLGIPAAGRERRRACRCGPR